MKVQKILSKSYYYAMTRVTQNFEICDISGFQDSINRKWVEDNTKTSLISY